MAVKKKKSDPFWFIMVVIAVFSFITSYFIFYQLTGNVETKSIKTSKPIVVSASPEDTPIEKTIVIGEGQGGSPSPEGENVTITPEPSGGFSAKPVDSSSSPSVAPTDSVAVVTPIVSATPLPIATVIPTPVKTLAPVPTKVPVSITPVQNKVAYFKVRVGSFDSRGDADKKAKDLESLGYETAVIDEPEGSYIQLGSFKDQEKALSLAEEVSQKGFSVIIRQLEE
jgi:cell division septation protein DedD